MMQINLHRKLKLHGVCFHSDLTGKSEVHIDMRDGEERYSPLAAYVTMTVEEARRLAGELTAAADRCDTEAKSDATADA